MTAVYNNHVYYHIRQDVQVHTHARCIVHQVSAYKSLKQFLAPVRPLGIVWTCQDSWINWQFELEYSRYAYTDFKEISPFLGPNYVIDFISHLLA